MDLDKIIQELNQRFAAPLKEFYKRRIIFWYDPEGEFSESIGDIVLDNAKLLILTGTNNFAAKKLLSVDDILSNYLVYSPLSYDDPKDNWLLDIELYSEEFRADQITIWMDELGLPQTPAMRKQVKEYRKYFGSKARREKIAGQKIVPSVPAQLHMAIMGALGCIKDISQAAIIKEVLKAGLDINANHLYLEFVNYGADKAFWTMVSQGTGYDAADPDLGRLSAHIIMTATTRTMSLEYLKGLDGFISSPHQAFCYDLVSDWLHDEDREQLFEIARLTEEELKLLQRFMKLDISDLWDTEIFPSIDEVILTKLMSEIRDHVIDDDMIRQVVEKRRGFVYHDLFKTYYEGLLQIANMQAFYKKHGTGFHFGKAKELWEGYASEYYLMDTYYRLFHKSFADSLKEYDSVLHDKFSTVAERAEGIYKNWFLSNLNSNWQSTCADELERYGRILEVPQQTDFYRNLVENADSRVFVVISDAMRYEVAASLSEELRRETQADVKFHSMQGIFPTITKFGMAALLPHRELEAKLFGDTIKVLADGTLTDAGYRDKILKSADPCSIALRYSDLVSVKRAERSAMVKGMKVVYIYHDTIDEASHTSDSMVFQACDRAIMELKTLAKIICNDFGATHILFTADHGFLYTYSPLTEDDKIEKKGFAEDLIEYGRRYAIMKKGADPDYMQKVAFLGGTSEYDAFAPKENVRIKMSGSGLNFVHGGISLQEMVVPVVDYHFLRNQYKQYQNNQSRYDTKPVEIGLLSSSRKISNMIFSLNFYQKEPVGDNRDKATYYLYFTDESGKQVSDTVKIVADKQDEDGNQRIFRCSFNLKSLKFDNKKQYYLVIASEDGMINSREEFQIDIPFAMDDFNFFRKKKKKGNGIKNGRFTR